eukprot:CAMPEP_0194347434 /NCGR_PEP_ID=MMETSP0171-20130528/105989_1 /TAXON_ID=218684 /ORGANISM="Corethron pennatum, Strain L29A3" /LENGTH=355 /DNA_ID=CAMNT_0039114689 /DNA_START=21 /DNA_END=1085 /DNA_ORIENTATION=-
MNPDRFEAKEIDHAFSASINDAAIFQGREKMVEHETKKQKNFVTTDPNKYEAKELAYAISASLKEKINTEKKISAIYNQRLSVPNQPENRNSSAKEKDDVARTDISSFADKAIRELREDSDRITMNPDRFEAREISHAVSASINDEAIFQGNRNIPASSANFAPNNPEIRPPEAAAVINAMNTGRPSRAAVVSNSANTDFEEQTQISPVRFHSIRLHASEVTVVQPTKHQQIFCTGFHRKKLLISGFLFCLVAVIIVGAFLGFLLSSTPTDGPTFLRTTQLTLPPTAGPTISTTAEPILFPTARPSLFPTAMQQTATPTRNKVTGQADVSCGGHIAISCTECPYDGVGNYMGQGW